MESPGANERMVGIDADLGSLEYRPVVRVSVEASISDAARELHRAQISSVLVGNVQRTLVTERDIVRALAEGIDPAAAVTTIASRAPLWITTTSTVADAARLMEHHEVRHLIVIESNGREIGVISMRDVLAVLLSGLGRH
jgi:predicted transcriptional regulator